MASRRRGRKKNYKQMIAHHKETAAGDGGWDSFAYLYKEDDRKFGYTDYIKIHWIVDDRVVDTGSSPDTDAPNLFSNQGFGALFVASYQSTLTTLSDGESNQLDPRYVKSVVAANGMAGSVSMPIKHLHQSLQADTDERDGHIYLWMKLPDSTVDDDYVVRFFIESFGRWNKVSGL